jgi:hypothetical protein
MLLAFIVALSNARCPDMRTNVFPPWSRADFNGYVEVKMKCNALKKPCVAEFFKTTQGYYRGVCSDPIQDSKSLETAKSA